VMAKVAAVRKFKATGWHHDPGYQARAKAQYEAVQTGAGRWYCPTCARRTHL
jgi:hypothetical protein